MSGSQESVARWRISAQLQVQYDIIETLGVLDPASAELLTLPDGTSSDRHRLVVLDDRIDALYGHRVRKYFHARRVPITVLVVSGMEDNKNMNSVHQVVSAFNRAGISRRGDPPIAIGGGVLQDVIGLAASLFRRGIPFVRVPTTLLSQVDVSVAAKNGVNYEGFRNRLGSYSPPPRTLIDRSFLATVPERHISNGLGEILKMAMIKDARLFDLLETHGADLVTGKFQQGSVAQEVLRRAVGGMVEELEPNLWETCLERAVDYGHSFSPLVEMTALPELLHGEAVALDCVLSTFIAVRRGFVGPAELDRVVSTALSLGLPVYHPMFTDVDLLTRALEDTVRHRNGDQNLPLMSRIGAARFINDLTAEEVASAATEMAALQFSVAA